jgi:uncharacterized membrane protein YjjP (DUF1212 family)
VRSSSGESCSPFLTSWAGRIVIAGINSFIAAALASTNQFCFAAVASGSVVLILPGYIILCGSLELANRSIISGSVRTVFAILYSLFLGFGYSLHSSQAL